MIDKPRINRDQAARQDRTARHVKGHLERTCGLLHEGERLGEPSRMGAMTVIPITRDNEPEGGRRDVRSLVSA